MIPRPCRLLGGLLLLTWMVGMASVASAQLGDIRSVFKEPKTPAEFWSRMKFEMDLGNYSVAAQYLNGLLKSNPAEKDLLDLEKTEGSTAFLKLRNVPRWVPAAPSAASAEAKKDAEDRNKQANQDVEDLIKLVTDAVRKNLADPDRIRKYVNNLTAGKEEYEYAMGELYRSGTLAVPYIIDELRTADGDRRVALLRALTQFGPETLPPIIAGLDSNIPSLQIDLIAVLRKRGAKDAVPTLYWILGNTASPPALKDAARDALVVFTQTPANRLPSGRAALTEEAERYYQHQVQFPDPKAVVVWRWDGDRVVQGFPDKPTLPATKVEAYYGTRYATQALALDPAYEPAQQVLVSLILDKNYEETGTSKPLSETRPEVHQRLSSLNPALLAGVLERAMRDQRSNVIIGSLRLLGDQGDIKSRLSGPGAQPPLVRALDYPDPRVQFLAAETELRMACPVTPTVAVRVVEILKRAITPDPLGKKQPRVMLGYMDEDRLAEAAVALGRMGYQPVSFTSGRAMIRRLQEGSDIDAIILDADLPDPGLPNFLAQLKADRNARNLPVILTSELRSYDRWRLYTERMPQVKGVVPLRSALLDLQAALGNLLRVREREQALAVTERVVEPLPDWEVLTDDDVKILFDLLPTLREATRNQPSRETDLLILRNRLRTFIEAEHKAAYARLTERNYSLPPMRPLNIEELRDAEMRMNRERLQKFINRDLTAERLTTEDLRRLLLALRRVIDTPRPWPISPREFERIGQNVADALGEPEHKPLTAEETQDFAERSIRLLARMARKEICGYDIRSVDKPVYDLLRARTLSPEGQIAAVQVIGTMTGSQPQPQLLAAVVDEMHPKEVRIAATVALTRHIQLYGLTLRPVQTVTITQLSADPNTDAAFRSALTTLLGVLNPSARLSGERLQGYQPNLDPVPMPEKPPEK